MALMKKTQRSFSGGQLDKDLMGRQDLQKYSQGCLVLENFKVRKQGNIIKRSGTDLVCDFSDILSNKTITTARIIPIVQERENGYYMLLTDNKAYLISPDGMKMANGTWSRTPTYAGSPYSVSVPFNDSDLHMLDWCQSGDTIFFAHRSYAPCKIVYSTGTLTYEQIQFRQASGTQPIISAVTASGTWGSGSTKEIEYCVTAVKDGIESAPSPAYAVSYSMPWGDTCSFKITIDSTSIDADDFDCFYIYKKESDVFGLIGTTSNQVSFVSISDSFSTTHADLYPNGYSNFDQTVHLRDDGNKFASVSEITNYTKEDQLWSVKVVSHQQAISRGYVTIYETRPSSRVWRWCSYNELDLAIPSFVKKFNQYGSWSQQSTSKSSTAQLKLSSGQSKIEFALNTNGVPMSEVKIGLGSLEHKVDYWYYDILNSVLNVWQWESVYRSDYMYSDRSYTNIGITETHKWTANNSVFTPCPAKYFKIKIKYWDGSQWQNSSFIDCQATVDQTPSSPEWVQQQDGTYKRTYAESEYVLSTESSAKVLAMMDAKAPSVGAYCRFKFPQNLQGKKVKTIYLYGYESSAEEASSASLVVNGISCYQGGKYVYEFTDNYITPDLTITPPKSEDHFVNPSDYPACVQLYSQRLCYASSTDNPFTFWMSCVGDLYNFDTHEYLRASDAIKASTAALKMPKINRMLVHRDLMMFADGGEWQVSPSSGNAISPSTIAAKLQSTIGCAAWIKPLTVDSDIIFCDGSGETLHSTRYNFASDGYESNNLSVLSQRLFRNNRIVAMAYAQYPESTIECVLNDGSLASLVFMKEHDVCAWSRHTLGGSSNAIDVAANESTSTGSSSVAIIATRKYAVINDSGDDDGDDNDLPPASSEVRKWFVLGVRDIDPNDDSLSSSLRMDAIRYVTTSRSNGEIVNPDMVAGEVAVRIGEVRTSETVEGETVVTVTGDKFAVGLPFSSVMKTTSPEFTDEETAQMEIKNATESEVRVIDGSDFTVRQSGVSLAKATNMTVPCPIVTTADNFTCVPSDADCKLPLTGNNARNGSIVIQHDGYLPLSILSVTTTFDVEYENHPPKSGGQQGG